MKIIVGLGNPGKQYEKTRHNYGFMLVDALARKWKIYWTPNKKFKAEIAKYSDFLLVKPQTYMNLSGESVAKILSYYKIDIKNLNGDLIVVHDDIDIEFGKSRQSFDSRSAGHNGVQSIIDDLKTKNFCRLRLGIKPPPDNRIPTVDYVLQKFSKDEMEVAKELIKEIIKTI